MSEPREPDPKPSDREDPATRPESSPPVLTDDESFFTPTPVPPDAPDGEIGLFRRHGPLDWITDPELYQEMYAYADQFDASDLTDAGLSFPMFCLRRFAPYPLHRLSRTHLLHFTDNLWTHLMPEIPWSWSQLFVAWLSGDVPPSARWFLDRLVECARLDARNPEGHHAPAAWEIGAGCERGHEKPTQQDFVFVTNRRRVWFCMVSDGVSRSTIGSGEDASLGVGNALNSHLMPLERELEQLNCALPEKAWRARAEKTLSLIGHWINEELIAEIRRRHPGPIQLTEEVMSVTSTMVLVRDTWCSIAQCGDSGAYLFQDGLMIPVTQEHSVRFANILSCLTGQSQFPETRNNVTRLLPNTANTASVQVLIPAIENLFTFSFLYLGSNSRLLVCTDGLLSKALTRRVMLNQILRRIPKNLNAQGAAEWILWHASAQNGEDNLSLCWIAPAL